MRHCGLAPAAAAAAAAADDAADDDDDDGRDRLQQPRILPSCPAQVWQGTLHPLALKKSPQTMLADEHGIVVKLVGVSSAQIRKDTEDSILLGPRRKDENK